MFPLLARMRGGLYYNTYIVSMRRKRGGEREGGGRGGRERGGEMGRGGRERGGGERGGERGGEKGESIEVNYCQIIDDNSFGF